MRLFSLSKNLPIPPPFLQDLHKELLGCGCRGPTTFTELIGCERVEIIIIIIITMEKGLYPLSGVSMGGWWWWCTVSCWVVPTRGGPTTDVGADLLGQPWEGRDFSKPFLGRNNILPWAAGNSSSHATQCFCRDSMAWAGGEWDLEEKLEFGLLLDAVEEELHGTLWLGSDSSSSPLGFGEEKRGAELLGWPDLVLTGTSIKFPWLSRCRHRCKVFWGQDLQESKNWKGTQLLWSCVAGCFPKCSHPCGPWPQHPFSAVQAELQEKQLFVFFPLSLWLYL